MNARNVCRMSECGCGGPKREVRRVGMWVRLLLRFSLRSSSSSFQPSQPGYLPWLLKSCVGVYWRLSGFTFKVKVMIKRPSSLLLRWHFHWPLHCVWEARTRHGLPPFTGSAPNAAWAVRPTGRIRGEVHGGLLDSPHHIDEQKKREKHSLNGVINIFCLTFSLFFVR